MGDLLLPPVQDIYISSLHFRLVLEEHDLHKSIGNVKLISLDGELRVSSLFLPTRLLIKLEMTIMSLS
jgi:hypothetical protein